MDQSPPKDSKHSETTSSACLVQGTRMSILTPVASECDPISATNPLCGQCENSSHAHTRLIPVHTHHSERLPFQLLSLVNSRIYINSAHTQSTWNILCCSCALQPCQRLAPQRRLSFFMLSGTSVGAGCDGLLQLQVQGSSVELKAAVAGLTDTAGLKQLLAWHWDFLVTTAGAEHITTVPAKRTEVGQ